MSNYAMTAAEKEARIIQIIGLARVGNRASAIAPIVGLTKNYVLSVMRRAGLSDYQPSGYQNGVSELWDQDEDDRRAAIWRRQVEGARKTLQSQGANCG